MSENENKYNYEKIANSIISYLNFIKEFKKIKPDDIILNEPDDRNKYSYIFREFNIDCYIIDKKSFDDFRYEINFNDLTTILDPINDENINLFKKELKEYLDSNPLNLDIKNVKIYSKKEEMKEIVKNFNNYSFINRDLLIDGMGLSLSQLEGNLIKVSKNENYLSLLSVNNHFIINIKNEKKEVKEKVIAEYKNLYYVEEITKKIFILLYFNEQIIKQKIKKNIKDIYNFKKYYLINKKWLNEYKEFFLYDIIIKKLKENYNNYSYKRSKNELNKISSDLGQIRLFSETKISNDLRNAKKLISETTKINLKNEVNENENNEYQQDTAEIEDIDKAYFVPNNFYLINEDIYYLLKKEEFFYNMNEEIEDKLSYEILLGNNQITIKNKISEEDKDLSKFLKNYLIYFEEKENSNEQINNNVDAKDKYILKYILTYNKDNIFYCDFKYIIEKGLDNYFKKYEINIDKMFFEQNIVDDKKNVLGTFINIGIFNIDDIKNKLDSNKIDLIIKKEIENNYINTNIKINNYDKLQIKNEININFIHEKKIENISDNSNNHNNNFNDNNNTPDIIDNNTPETIDKNIEIITKEKNEINLIIENVISLSYNQSSNLDSLNINDKDITNSFNDKEISFEKLKRKIYIIEPIMEKLFIRLDNNEKKNLDINVLIPEEIINKKDSKEIDEIILINDKEIKDYIKYDLINKYLNSNEKEKNELLKNHKDDFIKINSILKFKDNKINSFSLIQNYNECDKNINENNKFIIVNKKIFKENPKAKNIFIYYFKYYDKSYIFFEKDKKILQLIKDDDYDQKYLYNLKGYKIDRLELLNYINIEINKYKEINDLNLNENIDKNIKEYYLINNHWIDSEINKKKNFRKSYSSSMTKNDICPNCTHLEYLNYPTEFGFIEKDKFESIINYLNDIDNEIDIQNIMVSKIFFINWQNINSYFSKDYFDKNFFIGILDNDNNSIIYFYLYRLKKYLFQFVLKFKDKNIANEEIQKSIKLKGIGQYLNEMGIDFSKVNVSIDLANINLENIGKFINFFKIDNLAIWTPNFPKNLKYIDKSGYFICVLECLINIESLKDFFLNRLNLIEFIDKDSIFTKNFYKIVQDLWNWYEENDNNDIYIQIMEGLKEKDNSNNILNNLKKLIESILLNIHNELKTNEKGEKIETPTNLYEEYKDEKELKTYFYSLNNSIIQELFFFDLELNYYCDNCQENKTIYSINCLLEFDFDKINFNNNQAFTINNIFQHLNEDIYCNNCNQPNKLIKKIINPPQYLIIIFHYKEINNLVFIINEYIDIKDFIRDSNKLSNNNNNLKDTKYELVSLIQDVSVACCKSLVNKKWYKYNNKEEDEYRLPKKINLEKRKKKSIPYLLIYKIIK